MLKPLQQSNQKVKLDILFERALPEHIMRLLSLGADSQLGLECGSTLRHRVFPGQPERLDRIDQLLLLFGAQPALPRWMARLVAALDHIAAAIVYGDFQGVILFSDHLIGNGYHPYSSRGNKATLAARG